MDGAQQIRRAAVAVAALDPDRALRHGGKHLAGIDRREAQIAQSEALQPGDGEERAVGDAVLELAQARLDIAAELHHRQIGADGERLRPAAQRGRADRRARGKLRERGMARREKRIARIRPRKLAVEDQARRPLHGDVLHRVHRQIHPLRQQRLVDLAGEQPLSADLAERAVRDPVSGGRDRHDLEGAVRQPVRRRQRGRRLARLRERQRRAPRCDSHRRRGRWHALGHANRLLAAKGRGNSAGCMLRGFVTGSRVFRNRSGPASPLTLAGERLRNWQA